MRHLYIITLFTCLVACLGIPQAHGQTSLEVKNELVESFLQGSSDRLARHLGGSVEIIMNGERNVYTSTQAKFVLKKFFSENTCNSFQIKNEGESGGMYYARADFRGNSAYWITLFIKGAKLSRLKIERK